MRQPFHLLVLFSIGLIGCASKHPGPIMRDYVYEIPANPLRQNGPSVATIWHGQRLDTANHLTADIVAEYNGTGFRVPSLSKDPQNRSRLYRASELISFFDSRPRKERAFVIFSKNVWSDTRLKSEIAKTNRYFFARGYKRVVIQQAGGGLTFQLLSDQKNPTNRPFLLAEW